ncbi:unnamed protein product, partial [Penicillium nalgiovense]
RPYREVLSHYDCTISCHRWVRRAPLGSEVARYIRRGFFEVTAGECDELNTTSYQHGMNGDCITEDNWGTAMFPLLESKRASALSARALRYRCDPMLYHPDMTIGGIDDEPMYTTDRQDKAVYTEAQPSHPAAFYRQQSKLDRMNPGTTPQKATTGGSDTVLDIDTAVQ